MELPNNYSFLHTQISKFEQQHCWFDVIFFICLWICCRVTSEQKLEETRDELHRSTEAESSLRNRCACLERKQMQKEERIEVKL